MKRMMRKLGLICEPHMAGITKIRRTKSAAMLDIGEGMQQGLAEKMKQYHAEETNTWANCPYDFEMEQELSDMGWSQSEIAYIREKYNK